MSVTLFFAMPRMSSRLGQYSLARSARIAWLLSKCITTWMPRAPHLPASNIASAPGEYVALSELLPMPEGYKSGLARGHDAAGRQRRGLANADWFAAALPEK